MGTSYTPGEWRAVVTDRFALLVEYAALERLESIWVGMTEGGDFEGVLDAVSGGRLANLPAFALAGHGPDGVRLLVRPGVSVVVDESSANERTVTCDGWRTWADVLLTPGSRVTMRRDITAAAEAGLPLLGGIVAADAVSWPSNTALVLECPTSIARPTVQQVRPRHTIPDDPPAAQAPLSPAGPAPVPQPMPEPAPVPSMSDPAPALSQPSAMLPDPLPKAEALPPPLPAPAEAAEVGEPEEVTDAGSEFFDVLYGMTRPGSVESAAVRDSEDEDAADSSDSSDSRPLLDVIPGLSADHSLPAASSLPGSSPAVAKMPIQLTDTVMGLRPETMRPKVLAIACPAGHPNPPRTPVCRECGVPVEYTEPVAMTRPRLGVLRFSTGQTVGLDQSVLIGRNPTVARVAGGDLPTIVPLDDANKDISRTHAEIRLDDWEVLLVDLGSSNGTFATIPGRAEQRLQAQLPLHLVPGTVVRLANDVTFLFEAR